MPNKTDAAGQDAYILQWQNRPTRKCTPSTTKEVGLLRDSVPGREGGECPRGAAPRGFSKEAPARRDLNKGRK